jgi:hypothetical protein
MHARHVARRDHQGAVAEVPDGGCVDRIEEEQRRSGQTTVLLSPFPALHASHREQCADLPRVGATSARDALEEGRLARPRTTDDRYAFTEREVQ